MAKKKIRIKKTKNSFRLYKLLFSIVIILLLLTLFLGSKTPFIKGLVNEGKNTAQVLGDRIIALTNSNNLSEDSSETQGEYSPQSSAAQFDGSYGEGGVAVEGGGGGGIAPGDPESEETVEVDEVCNDDGYCEVIAPSDANTESDYTAENIDFQEYLDADSLPTEEDVEENLREISEIVSQIEEKDIRVEKVGGTVAIIQNEVAAIISIPLGVDPETNDLVTKTETGVKKINIFPDQAVENVLAISELSKITPPKIEETPKEKVAVSNVIKLDMRDDVPVYEIHGDKDHKLLGFIPVTTTATVYVSAETGKAVAKEQSVVAKVAEFLSPKKKKAGK